MVAEAVPGEMADVAVILMRVVAAMGENDVRRGRGACRSSNQSLTSG